jgi:uncharacterized membrane protein HdeD (DUF308 family)
MSESTAVENVVGEVRKNWGWLLFIGVALIVLGAIGLYMTGALTLVSMLYFGILVIAGGILMLIDAFKAEGWKEKTWNILIALAYIIVGMVMIANPGKSAAWFTLFISAFLLVSGAFRVIMGFKMRKEVGGWVLTVIGGVASIVLAVMIFSQWPVSGLWVIGLFIAIEMIMHGISLVTIALACKANKAKCNPAT